MLCAGALGASISPPPSLLRCDTIYYSRVQITCRPENFGSRQPGALLGLFLRHRGKSNIEQNAASRCRNSRNDKLSAHDCIVIMSKKGLELGKIEDPKEEDKKKI